MALRNFFHFFFVFVALYLPPYPGCPVLTRIWVSIKQIKIIWIVYNFEYNLEKLLFLHNCVVKSFIAITLETKKLFIKVEMKEFTSTPCIFLTIHFLWKLRIILILNFKVCPNSCIVDPNYKDTVILSWIVWYATWFLLYDLPAVSIYWNLISKTQVKLYAKNLF